MDYNGHHDMDMVEDNNYGSAHIGMPPMNHTDDGGMMKMYFHTEYKNTIVLFKDWKITTIGQLFGSLIAIFILAALYEGLKVLREVIQRRYHVSIHQHKYSAPLSNSSSDDVLTDVNIVSPASRMLSKAHSLQTVLHILQLVLSYFLMLIFMTYNIWLCMAVILGAGAGYFLFGWKKGTIVDLNEHCH